MQFDYFFIGVAIFGAIIGTITDLKTRLVPDWTNYFMIFSGLLGHAAISINSGTIWPLIYSVVAAGIFYAVGSLMFYSGAWGGGDAKMLVGFGALIPILPPTVLHPAPWPFLVTLWVNLLLFGAIFGLVSTFVLAIKHRKNFVIEFTSQIEKNKKFVYILPTLVAVPSLIYVFDKNAILVLIGSLAFVFSILVFVLRAVENACMHKQIMPSKLVEGDWVAEEVRAGEFTYKPERSGITKQNIVKLVDLEKAGKLKQIKVKDGLPYVPALLAGLLASVFYGDLFLILISKLV